MEFSPVKNNINHKYCNVGTIEKNIHIMDERTKIILTIIENTRFHQLC